MQHPCGMGDFRIIELDEIQFVQVVFASMRVPDVDVTLLTLNGLIDFEGRKNRKRCFVSNDANQVLNCFCATKKKKNLG